MAHKYRPVNILLVDDDEVDIEAMSRSFARRKIGNSVHVAANGLEALQFLRDGNGLERPVIILLDINMPQMNGLEFLQELRADPELNDLIVFVLTTSEDQNDVYAAYNLNVAGYMLKSEVGDSFHEAIDLIEHYWRVVELRA
ncbi:MAG: response regulator [Pseudomonadota bacterium]